MIDIEKRRKDVYGKVFQSTESMDRLIDPEDINEDAGSWSEISDDELDDEIHKSVQIQTQEGHYDNLVKGLAIAEWLNGMPRVRLEHLIFDTMEEALKNNYWPYTLSDMGAEAELHEMVMDSNKDIPNTARNRAHSLVHAATADKLDPRVNEPQYQW